MIGSFKQLNQKRQAYDKKQPDEKFTHPMFHSVWFAMSGSILSGILLALGFPGFGNATIVYAALVPLMFAVQSASPKKACWLGLLSGFVFFMMSLSWLHNLTGTVEGIGLKISAVAGFCLLALYCSLYFIPFTLAVSLGTRQWVGSNLWKNIRFMLVVTMVWTGFEYLRGILFTGFPWNPLGVSQYTNPTIIQIAEWGGVSIISACIIWMNAAIFVTFRQYTHGGRLKKYRPHFELMIGILPIALSLAFGMNVLFSRKPPLEWVRVALVQPGIPQPEKWNPEQDRMIRERLEQLTSTAARVKDLDLIIWPETAIPDYLRSSRDSYALVARMTALGTPLLVGTMDFDLGEKGRLYYNSSIFIGTDGTEKAAYNKQHLVPFGEYVPFPGLLRKFTPIPIDFQHGKSSSVFEPSQTGLPSFAALICFEDTVAPLAARAVRDGARWLVNQSNDAWFDPSAQSEQHLAHAIFRCIENRVPMARCCNTGVSCLIDAYGNVDRQLDLRTDGFASGMLSPCPVGQPKTFYTRHPNAFAQAALLFGTIALFMLRSRQRKLRKSRTA